MERKSQPKSLMRKGLQIAGDKLLEQDRGLAGIAGQRHHQGGEDHGADHASRAYAPGELFVTEHRAHADEYAADGGEVAEHVDEHPGDGADERAEEGAKGHP